MIGKPRLALGREDGEDGESGSVKCRSLRGEKSGGREGFDLIRFGTIQDWALGIRHYWAALMGTCDDDESGEEEEGDEQGTMMTLLRVYVCSM